MAAAQRRRLLLRCHLHFAAAGLHQDHRTLGQRGQRLALARHARGGHDASGGFLRRAQLVAVGMDPLQAGAGQHRLQVFQHRRRGGGRCRCRCRCRGLGRRSGFRLRRQHGRLCRGRGSGRHDRRGGLDRRADGRLGDGFGGNGFGHRHGHRSDSLGSWRGHRLGHRSGFGRRSRRHVCRHGDADGFDGFRRDRRGHGRLRRGLGGHAGFDAGRGEAFGRGAFAFTFTRCALRRLVAFAAIAVAATAVAATAFLAFGSLGSGFGTFRQLGTRLGLFGHGLGQHAQGLGGSDGFRLRRFTGFGFAQFAALALAFALALAAFLVAVAAAFLACFGAFTLGALGRHGLGLAGYRRRGLAFTLLARLAARAFATAFALLATLTGLAVATLGAFGAFAALGAFTALATALALATFGALATLAAFGALATLAAPFATRTALTAALGAAGFRGGGGLGRLHHRRGGRAGTEQALQPGDKATGFHGLGRAWPAPPPAGWPGGHRTGPSARR
ncbi:membrane hypothetical protein [Cupriavidus taiwanensis]|nr:membrane hypothetical protein [Cupriavidus taiwanensis]